MIYLLVNGDSVPVHTNQNLSVVILRVVVYSNFRPVPLHFILSITKRSMKLNPKRRFVWFVLLPIRTRFSKVKLTRLSTDRAST